MNGKELIKILLKEGWYLDRITGSHHIMKRGNDTVTVPVHGKKYLKISTFNQILKDAGLKK